MQDAEDELKSAQRQMDTAWAAIDLLKLRKNYLLSEMSKVNSAGMLLLFFYLFIIFFNDNSVFFSEIKLLEATINKSFELLKPKQPTASATAVSTNNKLKNKKNYNKNYSVYWKYNYLY